ncbi:MAG: hypothetical protein V1875_07600 [Candidatus Altiarchaeota archaeon]
MSKEADPTMHRRTFLRHMAAAGAALGGIGLMGPKAAEAAEARESLYVSPGAVKSIRSEDPDARLKVVLMQGDELMTAGYPDRLPMVGTRIPLKAGDTVITGDGKRHLLDEDRLASIQGVKIEIGLEREILIPQKIVAHVKGGGEGRQLSYTYRPPRELKRLGSTVVIGHVSGNDMTRAEHEAAISAKLALLQTGMDSVRQTYKSHNVDIGFEARKDGSVTVKGLDRYGIKEGASLRIGPGESTDIEISADGGKTWAKCPYPDTAEFNKADIRESYRLLWSVLYESGAYRLPKGAGASRFRQRQPPRGGY